MAIQRYSTPKITILVNPKLVRELWITISTEKGSEILTKTRKDLEEQEDRFVLHLKQEDTSKLPTGKYEFVLIQSRILFNDGNEVATDIVKNSVSQVLKEGIME